MRRLLSLMGLLVLVLTPGFTPPHDEPGPAADKVFFKSFNVDRAPLDIRNEDMDLYLFSLKTAAARELEQAGKVRLVKAPASSVSLILNPAPAPEGRLNPFSIVKVRRAMQYLVNRGLIASDIYQGQAVPMKTHVSPLDFDFSTVYDIVKESDIRYDPEFAREMIGEAMEEAGAELVDGVWSYNGRPIRIKLIGRTEDERRDIAGLVASELRESGFEVSLVLRDFASAVLTVYSGDPATLEWHIYTEGWGRGAPERYDFATINQMTAPWLGNMPGWREVGFWQYENEELDRLGKRLFNGQFDSLEERNQIYRRMTDLSLDASVRVWLVTALNSFPALQELDGVTRDIVAGPRAPWTLREAHMPEEDTLTVGHLWVWTERTVWNPVGGMGDVYSTDMWRAMSDPPTWNHPFAGIPEPFRASFEVETAGPEGELEVPADAVQWDAEGDRWQQVGDGARATSRVVFDYSKYFQSTWHHGQPIEMADVLYSIAQSYEIAFDEEKARIETALGVTSRPFLETFKGYRVVDENRLEVYLDFWHFEENYIASFASPAGLGMPWELLAAMDTLVFDKRQAAYSDTAAARFNVPWISLVMDRDARLVERTLRELNAEGRVPEGVFRMGGETLVTQDEATARYQAAMDWFDQYGHLVIANGPFFLARYDPPAQFAELRAFRQEDYPFKPGDWYFGTPEPMEIERVDAPTIATGQEARIPVSVEGPGSVKLDYLLFDPAAGEVVAEGEASRKDEGFNVALGPDVTGELVPGLYQLFLLASSDRLAVVSERRVDLQVSAEQEQQAGPTATPEPQGAGGTGGQAQQEDGGSGGFGCSAPRPGSHGGLLGMDLSVVIGTLGLGLLLARRRC